MATSFPLRFNSEVQKKKIESLAKDNGRSANAHILYLIDRAILSEEQRNQRMALIKKSKNK